MRPAEETPYQTSGIIRGNRQTPLDVGPLKMPTFGSMRCPSRTPVKLSLKQRQGVCKKFFKYMTLVYSFKGTSTPLPKFLNKDIIT